MAENIAQLLDNLPNSENPVDSLIDLKTLLGSIRPESLKELVRNISFNCVFDCLSTGNRDQIELCCDVLKRLLKCVLPSVILNQFHDELLTGLSHPSPPVRRLCVAEVGRVGSDKVEDLIQHPDVLVQIVTTIADDDLSISQSAGNVLSTLGSSASGLEFLCFGAGITQINKMMFQSDIIKFRLFEVVVNISKHWIEGLQATANCGVLHQLLNSLYTSDILLQLNCLELLSEMATAEHCLMFLDERGIVSKVEAMMAAGNDDPMAEFLIPGLVKFFGSVARFHPKEVLSKNEKFVHCVFSNLSSGGNPSLRSLAVQTLGFMGGTVEGKMALEKLGAQMNEGVKNVGGMLRESQSDVKIFVLQSLASLLKLEVRDQAAELIKLTERWYNLLGTNTFAHLMTLVEQPFLEIRCSALLLLRSLALQVWGQIILNNFPGFKEFLLNRNTESTKEGKDGKFDIIKALSESPSVPDIFGQPYFIQLKVYVNQGPFFVLTETQVAMEGE